LDSSSILQQKDESKTLREGALLIQDLYKFWKSIANNFELNAVQDAAICMLKTAGDTQAHLTMLLFIVN